MRFELGGDRVGKAVAIDRERAAGRHLVGVAGRHDQRAGQPHFGVQHADGIALGIVGAEGIGADEFGKAVGLVRIGAAHRRISCRMTGTPASATCQAASEPARPPPMTWMGFVFMAAEIILCSPDCNYTTIGRVAV